MPSLELDELLAANREWAARIVEDDPESFTHLSEQQNPSYLWIGCADSRVPANQIVGLPPGEVFGDDLFCEINVRSQVPNDARTTVVQDAWARGHEVAIHRWVYGLKDGLLRDPEVDVARPLDLETVSPEYGP